MTDYERENLRSFLLDYLNKITERAKGKNKFICPLCGSGKGENHTAAFSVTEDGKKWKCFSCDNGGDLFDLIGLYENLKEYRDQENRARDLFLGGHDTQEPRAAEPRKANIAKAVEPVKEKQENYTEFYKTACQHLKETDYPEKRGLSLDTLQKYGIGYAPTWRNPKAQSYPPTPRLIIPTGKGSYLARDTREQLTDQEKKYSKMKVGSINIFNLAQLIESPKPVFVVEGEIDALSVIEVGGVAIGLGSTANADKLIKYLENKKKEGQAPRSALLLALDNDGPGRKAQTGLAEKLSRLKIANQAANINGPYKDPNEFLQKEREKFTKQVALAERIAPKTEKEKQEKKADYRNISAGAHLQEFLNGIAASANTGRIATDFPKLDTALDGGLYEGLYILGAISSLGKTTLITQIGDQIAKKGQDVLIFSLEMARTELMAKSISRLTAQLEEAEESGNALTRAKTARGITDGNRWKAYNRGEKELIQKAVMEYEKYASHIFIAEGLGDIGPEQIRGTVTQHITTTGQAPVIIIDYLQIVAAPDPRASDKQNMDKIVMELKRISRDYKTPVIVISSFNRDNYDKAVTMASFKESGGIEYSSDVLLGLQLAGVGGKDFDATQAKKKEPREVELIILKNRNGRVGDKIKFFYNPLFNLFYEA